MIIFTIIQLAIGGFVSCLLVFRYATTNKGWIRSPVSHLVLTTSSIVGIFYLYFLANFIWPHIPLKAITRTVLFTALTAALVWCYVVFEYITHGIKTEKKNENS